jgi:hypothetical protein
MKPTKKIHIKRIYTKGNKEDEKMVKEAARQLQTTTSNVWELLRSNGQVAGWRGDA